MRAWLARSALTLALAAPLAGAHAATPIELDLATLDTSSGVLRRIHGSAGNGNLGVPVCGGHDVDGDGFRDSAFAALRASPLGRSGAGQVHLVFGDGQFFGSTDTALASPDVLTFYGSGTLEAAGSELWMDDVTGDGLGDLLIARQNFRPDAARPGAGALSIVVGGPDLRAHAATLAPFDLAAPPAGATVATLHGAAAIDRLGIWMRTGDVTGDGIADIVVGADQEDGNGENDRGAVYVIRGGAHLDANVTIDLAQFGTTAWAGHLARITPPAGSDEDHFGATCQIADLDDNGRAEVLAAAALNRAGAGIDADGAPFNSAHGTGGSLDGTLYIAWDDNFNGDPWPAGFSFEVTTGPGAFTRIDGGGPNISFGEEIIGGLDYDDDGESDLLVGDIVGDWSPSTNRPAAGSAHLFYDADRLRNLDFDMNAIPPQLTVTTFAGAATGDIAGDTALHGDFDHDGIADVAFAAPHADPLGRDSAGTVYVVHGQSGPGPAFVDLAALPVPGLTISRIHGALGSSGGDSGDTLAYSAAAADLNGDGHIDLILNEMEGNGLSPGTTDVGNLILVRGFNLTTQEIPTLPAWALAALLMVLGLGSLGVRLGRGRR